MKRIPKHCLRELHLWSAWAHIPKTCSSNGLGSGGGDEDLRPSARRGENLRGLRRHLEYFDANITVSAFSRDRVRPVHPGRVRGWLVPAGGSR
jgi:hypothetical protein